MTKLFKRDSQVKSFKVENDKVYTTIVLNDFRITNPSLEQFLSVGWEEYIPEQPKPYIPTLEELTVSKIRIKYSLNQELEIQRKRDRNPEDFEEYDTYVEECIASAKKELNIE